MAEYTRSTSGGYWGGSTKYKAYADKPERDSVITKGTIHKSAELVVNNAREIPMYNYEYEGGHDPWNHAGTDAREEERRYAEIRAAKGHHTQLSMLHGKPAEFYAFSADPSMRIPAMTLAARAVLDHPGIVAADDLSAHSSRLVHKGMELGIIEGHPNNPAADITNEIGFDSLVNFKPAAGLTDKIPDIEIKEAKNFLRTQLRAGREKPSNLNRNQFHQQTLFGE